VVDAALALAAERRWRDVTMAEIAARAGVDLAQLQAQYPSKQSIVAAFSDRVDAASFAAPEAPDEPVRDRLLDLLMRRFDALAPHKRAIASILCDAAVNPCASFAMGPRLMRSMARTLEAAEAGHGGLIGLARAKVLTAIYLGALCVWLREDDPDLARTMAHLDRQLRRAERWAELVGRTGPFHRPQPGAAAA
jgi:AcrR family transcriptional regulator